MTLKRLPHEFAVVKLSSPKAAHGIDLTKPFVFLSVTDDEVSLVCPADLVPADATAVEAPWTAFKIAQTLDFSLVGIIAKIARCLAERGIPVFVISTFDTDYVLVKQHRSAEAIDALTSIGYDIVD